MHLLGLWLAVVGGIAWVAGHFADEREAKKIGVAMLVIGASGFVLFFLWHR
jgi:hypothetical protein